MQARGLASPCRDLEHDDGLAVLRVHGVEQLALVVAAGLPVGEVHAALAGGRAEFRRHERGAARGIELEGDVGQPAREMPGRRQ
jgi:hypothetical protein